MQTIIVLLDAAKLVNPDLDLRYKIPDCIEEVTNGRIQDNGYDYIDSNDESSLLGIWLETENAAENYKDIVKLFQKKKFLNNDLSKSAEIYISENETDDLKNCTKVFPA
ncbi:MAG: hypothetical protein HFH68_12240 [Lachnospiraceae bacterium]|nr:hypothetical protein [Lachnospiraceae bacterium]